MDKPGKRRWLTVRRASLILAAVVVLAVIPWRGVVRRAQYQYSGATRIDGLVFYLDPEDRNFTRAMLAYGCWEPGECQVLSENLKPGDTIIDVGANVGWYTVNGSRLVGPAGRVIAFEPEPRAFGLMTRSVAANGLTNVVAEQKALSDAPGTLTLHLNPTNHGNHSLVNSFDGKVHIEVPAVTLDAYLRDYRGNVALVKMDTEGAEGLILRGMKETIARFPRLSIVMEFNPSWIKQTGIDPETMLRGLHDEGFSIAVIEDHGGPRALPVEGLAALIKEIDAEQASGDPGAHRDLFLRRSEPIIRRLATPSVRASSTTADG